MGFFRALWKNNIQKAHLPKICIPGQIVFELIAQLCLYDAIQIILNLTQLITSETESNLEGLGWSHQSKTGQASLTLFAPQC